MTVSSFVFHGVWQIWRGLVRYFTECPSLCVWCFLRDGLHRALGDGRKPAEVKCPCPHTTAAGTWQRRQPWTPGKAPSASSPTLRWPCSPFPHSVVWKQVTRGLHLHPPVEAGGENEAPLPGWGGSSTSCINYLKFFCKEDLSLSSHLFIQSLTGVYFTWL